MFSEIVSKTTIAIKQTADHRFIELSMPNAHASTCNLTLHNRSFWSDILGLQYYSWQNHTS
jgi:hypothetical protein